MRRLIVDTAASVAFFTTVAALSELFVAGIEPREVLVTRLVMVPVMVLTGRPYTAWRDVVLRRLAPRRAPTRTLADVAAFLSFQVPVYGATLLLAGASPREAAAALVAATGFMVLLARPFGLYVDAVRRLFRVVPGA